MILVQSDGSFRSEEPKDNFLQLVRNLATENGILIFDECTSGFRETFGLHKKYNVIPDIIMLGKH